MAKFNFRLEPVLKKRLEVEEDAVLAKSKAQREYQNQLKVLHDIRNSVNKTMEDADKFSTIGGLLAGNLYLDYLKVTELKQEKILQEKQRAFEIKTDDMIEARKDRMILEKFKERLQDKYNMRLNRLENKALDDHCTIIAHRNNNKEKFN